MHLNCPLDWVKINTKIKMVWIFAYTFGCYVFKIAGLSKLERNGVSPFKSKRGKWKLCKYCIF